MPDESVEFASLLCSRLCHDLLSPVGAMNNGIELLADETDPEMRKRCMDLLNESARSSASKLKYYRLAFGAAGGFGPSVDPAEAREVVEESVTGGGRTELGWEVHVDQMPKKAIKVLLNLVLIAQDALVRGGRIDVGAERNEDRIEIVVRAEGPRMLLAPELRGALAGEVDFTDLTARSAAAWMVHRLVSSSGGSVQVSPPDTPALLLGASIPS